LNGLNTLKTFKKPLIMKIYSKEEAKEIYGLRQGRHTKVHVHLLQLKPGEKMRIDAGSDWVSKTPPNRLVKRFADKHKWKLLTERTLDLKGWLVTRLA
jgi:hypothetical protein